MLVVLAAPQSTARRSTKSGTQSMLTSKVARKGANASTQSPETSTHRSVPAARTAGGQASRHADSATTAAQPRAAGIAPWNFQNVSVRPAALPVKVTSKPADNRHVPRGVEAAIGRSRGGGHALGDGPRARMESSFGADFRQVRVHTDAEADALNRAVNSTAFTTGRDIFFSRGSYDTESAAGRALLSHELTHVVQQGNHGIVPRNLVLGDAADRTEREADAIARQVPGTPPPSVRSDAGSSNTIRRFKGSADFIRDYEITGDIGSGSWAAAPITGLTSAAYIVAGTSGDLTINIDGNARGRTSGFIKGGMVFLTFSLEKQKIPFKCTPEGEITLESAAISRGHTTYDSTNMMNPFGSDIGVAIATSVDGSSSPKFLTVEISFAVGGGGITVSTGGPVGIGGPTLGGGGSESTSVPLRFNLTVLGGRKAAATPSGPASTTATATASASSTVTSAAPAHVTVPPPHSIYFSNEAQTHGNEGDLVRWAASLPLETKDAIRTGRLTTTVTGYASTTGTDKANFDTYSARRAEWVRGVLAHALGVNANALHVGWVGSYTAPPEDRSHPGGVANPKERRADISFAETAPTTSTTVTSTSSASSHADTH